MANLRPEIGMIKATRIVLEAIGGVTLDPEVEFPDWAAADDLLRTSAGKMRCDDFTSIDFRVEWEDAHHYRGTISGVITRAARICLESTSGASYLSLAGSFWCLAHRQLSTAFPDHCEQHGRAER